MSNSTFTVNKETLEVIATHIFDAPRELVFKMHSDPTLIPQWWGPYSITTVVEKMDVKVGGIWRFIQTDTQGNTFAFNGVYKEVTPPEKVVSTFEFEPMAGHILEETALFEEIDGKTKLTTISKYANIEDLEGMVASGMEYGQRESMERFEKLLSK